VTEIFTKLYFIENEKILLFKVTFYNVWTKPEQKLSHLITTNKGRSGTSEVRQKKQKLQLRPSAGKQTEVGLLISLLIGRNNVFALIVEACTSSFGPITEFLYHGKHLLRKQKKDKRTYMFF